MERGASGKRFRMRVDGMTFPSREHRVENALSEGGAHDLEEDLRRREALLPLDCRPDHTVSLAAGVQGVGQTPHPIEPLQTIASSGGDLAEYRLSVEGLMCADCEHQVSEALREAMPSTSRLASVVARRASKRPPASTPLASGPRLPTRRIVLEHLNARHRRYARAAERQRGWR